MPKSSDSQESLIAKLLPASSNPPGSLFTAEDLRKRMPMSGVRPFTGRGVEPLETIPDPDYPTASRPSSSGKL